MEEDDRAAVDGTSLEPAREPALGRHLATRDSRWGRGWAVVAAGVVGLVGVVLVARMLGATEPRSRPAPTATSDVLGPTSRPPGAGSFGNLVQNWSFEENLSGWQVL